MHRQATICHEVVKSVNCLFDQVLNVTMFKKKKRCFDLCSDGPVVYCHMYKNYSETVFGSGTLRFQAPSHTLYIYRLECWTDGTKCY